MKKCKLINCNKNHGNLNIQLDCTELGFFKERNNKVIKKENTN